MNIIVKKTNKSEKIDFPDSVVTIQLGRSYIVLTQDNIEEIINKLILFSKQQNTKELLIDFLIHLNDKGLINNHDFVFEKEAKKYINKYKQ